MTGALVVLILALSALAAARRRRYRRRRARAVIVSPRQSTVVARDGAVRSVQSAELTMPAGELEQLWSAANLENLARTYWRFLSRVTLGLIRVVYGEHERSVVLLGRPLTLLRFDAPEYVLKADRGRVRWRIRDGLLVARAGRGCGFLALDVIRDGTVDEDGEKLRIEVEVANFYPAIAVGFSMPVYEATQSSIHVLVTHAFLRSLAELDLAESKVGRLAQDAPDPPPTDGTDPPPTDGTDPPPTDGTDPPPTDTREPLPADTTDSLPAAQPDGSSETPAPSPQP